MLLDRAGFTKKSVSRVATIGRLATRVPPGAYGNLLGIILVALVLAYLLTRKEPLRDLALDARSRSVDDQAITWNMAGWSQIASCSSLPETNYFDDISPDPWACLKRQFIPGPAFPGPVQASSTRLMTQNKYEFIGQPVFDVVNTYTRPLAGSTVPPKNSVQYVPFAVRTSFGDEDGDIRSYAAPGAVIKARQKEAKAIGLPGGVPVTHGGVAARAAVKANDKEQKIHITMFGLPLANATEFFFELFEVLDMIDAIYGGLAGAPPYINSLEALKYILENWEDINWTTVASAIDDQLRDYVLGLQGQALADISRMLGLPVGLGRTLGKHLR